MDEAKKQAVRLLNDLVSAHHFNGDGRRRPAYDDRSRTQRIRRAVRELLMADKHVFDGILKEIQDHPPWARILHGALMHPVVLRDNERPGRRAHLLQVMSKEMKASAKDYAHATAAINTVIDRIGRCLANPVKHKPEQTAEHIVDLLSGGRTFRLAVAGAFIAEPELQDLMVDALKQIALYDRVLAEPQVRRLFIELGIEAAPSQEMSLGLERGFRFD